MRVVAGKDGDTTAERWLAVATGHHTITQGHRARGVQRVIAAANQIIGHENAIIDTARTKRVSRRGI